MDALLGSTAIPDTSSTSRQCRLPAILGLSNGQGACGWKRTGKPVAEIFATADDGPKRTKVTTRLRSPEASLLATLLGRIAL